MRVLEVTPKDYREEVRNVASVFDTPGFALLNAHKCDRIHFLVFQDSRRALAAIIGGKGADARMPFSAPHGCFSWIKTRPRLSDFYSAIETLEAWSRDGGYRSLEFRPPPAFYHEGVVSSLVHASVGRGFQVAAMELNHHRLLSGDLDAGLATLDPKARQKLKFGEEAGHRFLELQGPSGLARAYGIIQLNRAAKGYPLRLSLEELQCTLGTVPGLVFLVQDARGTDLAAAIVFLVAPCIAQVIYWGNRPGSEGLHPMNFLARKLEEDLRGRGIQVLDVGPSTEGGVPNFGLCDFKQSLGCQATVKHVLSKTW